MSIPHPTHPQPYPSSCYFPQLVKEATKAPVKSDPGDLILNYNLSQIPLSNYKLIHLKEVNYQSIKVSDILGRGGRLRRGAEGHGLGVEGSAVFWLGLFWMLLGMAQKGVLVL